MFPLSFLSSLSTLFFPCVEVTTVSRLWNIISASFRNNFKMTNPTFITHNCVLGSALGYEDRMLKVHGFLCPQEDYN